ncbi:lysozyme C, milk isozyme-like [Gopherus flavomarginatus]|uniref:lysozyme C, milk isozyme-like n=1 Tax=Gopherus flavomarginatus TaxID=286002 RepID=UPI0021CC0CC5|nr:lysozyme C, milk isozyme-like [Gopherus flavomarginatus]
MGVLGLVTLLASLSMGGRGKIFTRCELAETLQDSGMDGYEGYSLANWVCLAFYTSGFDTAAVGANADGSSDYGIFQINSGWWCQDAQIPSENLCHVRCQDLLNPDIKDDINCVKRVVQDPQGMEAWDDWKEHCEKQDLTEWVESCNL